MQAIRKNINTDSGIDKAEKEMDKLIVKTSKDAPGRWVTYNVRMGKGWGNFILEVYIHNRKPQSLNTCGAENCYRQHGGFFKNGEIIKPSPSFIKRFNFCPVSR